MSSAGGNNKDDSYNEYEQLKLANIARNKRKLDALNIPNMNNMVQQARAKKIAKKICHTSNATTEPHNLHTRSQRNLAQHEEEQQVADYHDDQSVGDFLGDNEDVHIGKQSNAKQKEKKGRGITRKDDIFSRTHDMPKLTILVNDHGQPVGKNSRQLSSVIGFQVRKKLSLGCEDWRCVDAEKKYELWTDIKAFYDLDDAAFNWVMRTAGRKWKEFKATLKWLYFNVELCDEEVTESQDNRVNDADWKTLMDYWRSPKSQARTEIAKVNRAKLELHHTSGSISYACSKHDLAVELGCPPSRDELFIKTHTRKNGVASAQAQPIINQLKEIVEARPELKERTIQQGDVFAAVCGEMEPRGYVRVMGLGPTPQDVGTPGLKCYTPTRLQMEILARKKAESEKAALEKCLDEMQARMDWWEQREQERVETPRSNVGSNSRDHANTRSDEIDEVGHHDDQGEEEYASADNEYYEEENQNLLGRRHAAAPPIPTRHNDAPRLSHDTLVGKDVILYAMLRSDLPVAKGTIISTNPSTVLGGQILGRQFCEVVVNVVLKRDAILPRPYADMETMADANMMSIAWPYKRLKVSNKASPSSQGTTGSGGRSQLRCS